MASAFTSSLCCHIAARRLWFVGQAKATSSICSPRLPIASNTMSPQHHYRTTCSANASNDQAPTASTPPPPLQQLSVTELRARLEQVVAQREANGIEAVHEDAEHDGPQLIDVREEFEAHMASLPHFQLLPTSQFAEWAPTIHTQLNPAKETIVLCHHGVRSMHVANYLVNKGFRNVLNVTGGIDAYSVEADPRVPRY